MCAERRLYCESHDGSWQGHPRMRLAYATFPPYLAAMHLALGTDVGVVEQGDGEFSEPWTRTSQYGDDRVRAHHVLATPLRLIGVKMAKLIYAAIASLDGYVADQEGRSDWGMPDEEVHAFVNDLERPIGTHLYGRRMYETMVFWETASPEADEP